MISVSIEYLEKLPFYRETLDYRFPILFSAFYVIVVTVWGNHNKSASTAKNNNTNDDGSGSGSGSKLFNVLVILHNLLLSAFSGFVFVQSFPLIYDNFKNGPSSLHEALCDVNRTLYDNGLGFWTWVFYLSKFYELIDTFVMLLKGKPSTFLQTFHHTGSIVIMWMITCTRTTSSWIFVSFNSFIHTCMYLYYTLTCLGYRPKWKVMITVMQLCQFVVGFFIGVYYPLMPECIRPYPGENRADVIAEKLFDGDTYKSQMLVSWGNLLFVMCLIVLFLDFSLKTYGSKSGVADNNVNNNNNKNNKNKKTKTS